MLHSLKELKGCGVHALDGDAGRVRDVYVDVENWTISHVIAGTGPWYARRAVLILPGSVMHTEWRSRSMRVWLTRRQVMDCPRLETVKPPLPDEERAFYNHFGYPSSWTGHYPWRIAVYPTVTAPDPFPPPETPWPRMIEASAMRGLPVHAEGKPVGRIDDLLFDDADWSIRMLAAEIATLAPGWHMLIAPERLAWTGAEQNILSADISCRQLEESIARDTRHGAQDTLPDVRSSLNPYK